MPSPLECGEAWLNKQTPEKSGRELRWLLRSVVRSQRAPLRGEAQGGDPRLSAPLSLYSRDGGRAQGLEKHDRKPRRPRSPASWLFVVAAPTQLSGQSALGRRTESPGGRESRRGRARNERLAESWQVSGGDSAGRGPREEAGLRTALGPVSSPCSDARPWLPGEDGPR